MKKQIAIALIVAATAMTITACGKKDNATDNNNNNGSSSVEVEKYSALDYVTLGEYKGIEVNVNISEDEIQSGIDTFLADNNTEQVTKGKVADGDTVNIDFEGKLDGEAFDGGTAQGFELKIGSGSFIDGFESGLVGVKVGDTVDLNLKFPDEYQNSPDLAGKDVVFTVTVNSIVKEIEPEFTDEFVAKCTDNKYKTAEEYKEKIKADLIESRKNMKGDLAFEEILASSTVSECPDFLLEMMKSRLDSTYKGMATSNGFEDFEEFLTNAMGVTLEQYNTQIESTATNYVEQKLVMEAIAEKENITVTQEEYDTYLKDYMIANNVETEEELEEFVKTNYASELDDLISESILLEKVIELIKENVVEVNEPVESETSETDDAE